jgi:hypothetical protein
MRSIIVPKNQDLIEVKLRRLLDEMRNEFSEWEIDEVKGLVDGKRYGDGFEAFSLRMIEGRHRLSEEARKLFDDIADDLDIH